VSREVILANLNSLKSTPVAIQALWDGDTTGWFIRLSAIADNAQLYPLGDLSDGGDIRLFSGQVPPWPEAAAARQLGNELAGRFGAEFYFPSPDHGLFCISPRYRRFQIPQGYETYFLELMT
jgi:hypothetical protein